MFLISAALGGDLACPPGTVLRDSRTQQQCSYDGVRHGPSRRGDVATAFWAHDKRTGVDRGFKRGDVSRVQPVIDGRPIGWGWRAENHTAALYWTTSATTSWDPGFRFQLVERDRDEPAPPPPAPPTCPADAVLVDMACWSTASPPLLHGPMRIVGPGGTLSVEMHWTHGKPNGTAVWYRPPEGPSPLRQLRLRRAPTRDLDAGNPERTHHVAVRRRRRSLEGRLPQRRPAGDLGDLRPRRLPGDPRRVPRRRPLRHLDPRRRTHP